MSSGNSSVIEQTGKNPGKENRYRNIEFNSKRKYSGNYIGNLRDGKGREEDFTKQTIYEGYFKDDMYDGEGILYQEPTKCYFKGMFSANHKKAGIEIFPNGDIYEGEYFNDKFHGKGYLRNGDLFYYEDNNHETNQIAHHRRTNSSHSELGKKKQATYSYKGEFYEGKRHGFGQEDYIRGSSYIGEFRNSQRHGKGKLSFPNGSYYEGDFVNGMPCGFGVHVAADSLQIAQLKPVRLEPGQNAGENNRKFYSSIRANALVHNDDDKDLFPDSQANLDNLIAYTPQVSHRSALGDDTPEEYYFEGEFIDGFKHGIGRLYFPDGSYFYSQWAFNMKVGEVIYYNSNQHKHSIFQYKNPEIIENHFECLPNDENDPIYQQIVWIVKNKPGYPPKEKDCYKSQIDDCAISGEQFEDESFRSAETSVFIHESMPAAFKKSLNEIVFMKLKDNGSFYFENKDLFQSPICPNSIVLSDFSDYQLIAAIEAITTYPHIFFKIFTLKYDYFEVGYLVLKLYIDGCWKEIVIDDIFPFLEDGNESIFSTSFNKDIGWIALQKAVCKELGYYMYHKKFPEEKTGHKFLQMLSGLPVKSMHWSNELNINADPDQIEAVWGLLDDPAQPSCKLAYLQPNVAQEKEYDIPVNFPYVILEVVDVAVIAGNNNNNSSNLMNSQIQGFSSSSQQQQGPQGQSHSKDSRYVILKSIEPLYSRIAKKYSSQIASRYPPGTKLGDALLKHQRIPSENDKLTKDREHSLADLEFFQKYKDGVTSSIFALEISVFCNLFSSVHLLMGVNQNFQSSCEINEEINVQQAESRFFFSFSLNLPSKILINIEQYRDKIEQDLPIRIVLALDKTGSMAKRVDGMDANSSFEANNYISRNKKEFLRRKFLNKVKVKKELKKIIKPAEKEKEINILEHSIDSGERNNDQSLNAIGGAGTGSKRTQEEDLAYLKKKYYNLQYIFGKGQMKQKNIFKNISLSEGTYILMISVEGPDKEKQAIKDFQLRLVLSIFGDNLLSISRILAPENFIQQVYEACIHQAEKKQIKNKARSGSNKEETVDIRFQKSDLGDRDNGSDQIIICQYYLHEEGTYLQLLDNRSFNKSWRQKLYFITENMKIFDSNDNNKVDVHLTPQESALIIIQQVKGLHYHLEGGEGVCLIENISKLSDSEGEKDDDDK